MNATDSQMKTALEAFEQGDFSAVQTFCAELLLRQPGHHGALELAGRAHLSVGDYAAALDSWSALGDQASEQLAKRLRVIHTLLQLKRHKEALQVAMGARQQWPDNPHLLFRFISIWHGLGNWEEVIAVWTKVNMTDSGIPEELSSKPFYVRICMMVTRAFVALENYDAAMDVCGLVLDRLPHHEAALQQKKNIHLQRGEKGEALAAVQILCREHGSRVGYWRQQIQLLCGMSKHEAARRVLEQAKSKFAEDALGCAQLAMTAESRMWPELAEVLLSTALQIEPARADFLEYLIESYWNLDRVDRSLHFAEQLKRLCHDTFTANPVVNQLQNLLRLAGVSENEILGAGLRSPKIFRTELVIKAIVDRVGDQTPVGEDSVRKIAMVSPPLLRGGAERQVVNCLKSLATDQQERFEVCLYTARNDNDRSNLTYFDEIRDLPITLREIGENSAGQYQDHTDAEILKYWEDVLQFLPESTFRKVMCLASHFLEQRPDVVHAWQDGINLQAGMAALIAEVPRIVLSARTLAPNPSDENPELQQYHLHADCWQAGYRHLLQHPRIRLCHNSQAGVRSYRQWLSVPSLKMPLFFNGVDFDGLARLPLDNQHEFRDQIEQLAEVPVVGTIMRFAAEKQPFLWMDAAKMVHSEFPRCRFLMVGYGDLLEDCRHRAAEWGMEEVFMFPGPTAAVKAWLDVMDLFLMTSHREGLPNAVIEAQGFGVPVVSTDVGGVREVIIDGETGWLTTADAEVIARTVIRALQDQTWLQAASAAGAQHALQKFSLSGMGPRLKRLYSFCDPVSDTGANN